MKILDYPTKKHSAALPEELVRVRLIEYLHSCKNVPLSLIGVEKEFAAGGVRRRYDAVVFSRGGHPLLLAECKAPSVALSNKVFGQAAHYNSALRAPFLLITNGTQTYCCRINFDSAEIIFLDEVPDYKEMKLWLKSFA